MSFLCGNPEGCSKTSENSAQIAYQRKISVVSSDIECRMDDKMPSYFTQASFGIWMGWSNPGSASLTYMHSRCDGTRRMC